MGVSFVAIVALIVGAMIFGYAQHQNARAERLLREQAELRKQAEAVTEQKHGGEMVVKAVEAIAVVSRQNLVAVEQMSGAAKSLAGESDALRQRVSLLQV